MNTPLSGKSSVACIARRFDADVARFSNLETGQSATMDAPLTMELITRAAVVATPDIRRVLDIGCGAGNNSIRLLRACGRAEVAVDLCDISRPMLDAAAIRVTAETRGPVLTVHADIRTAALPEDAYDVLIAAAVLHHLRDDADWEQVFAKLFRLLRPGGSLWITDLVAHDHPAVQALMLERYGDYLAGLGGPAYRDEVFAYIDEEDSPRSLGYQLDLLRRCGFVQTDVLHKHGCFAAFGAIKDP